jgi:hypothetical protein
MLLWFASLFLLRIIPSYHWHPIRHVAMSAIRRGSVLRFDPDAGLGSLEPDDRRALHTAVIDRMPEAALDGDDGAEGTRLVRLLRRAGRSGGVPIADDSELDSGISLYLFSDEPVAVRLKKMRELLSEGANAHDLRTLEDLRDDLSKLSGAAWALEPAGALRRAPDGGPQPRVRRA